MMTSLLRTQQLMSITSRQLAGEDFRPKQLPRLLFLLHLLLIQQRLLRLLLLQPQQRLLPLHLLLQQRLILPLHHKQQQLTQPQLRADHGGSSISIWMDVFVSY